MPMFRSAYGGTYTVTGAPVVVNDLASQITGSIAGLLIAALLVMARRCCSCSAAGRGSYRWRSRSPPPGSRSGCCRWSEAR